MVTSKGCATVAHTSKMKCAMIEIKALGYYKGIFGDLIIMAAAN